VLLITIDKKTNYISKFSPITRLIICAYIYNALPNKELEQILEEIIFNIKTKNTAEEWIAKIPKNDLKEISEKLNDMAFKNYIFNYFQDLGKIVSKLYFYFQDHKKTSKIAVNGIIAELFSEGITLGMAKSSLYDFLRKAFDYLKENCSSFNLDRITQTPLFETETTKECGHCHKIKNIRDFGITSEGSLKYVCKECDNNTKRIISYKYKYRIVLEIYNSKFKGKCSYCDTDFKRLPALEFHHLFPDKKSKDRISYVVSDYKILMKKLEKESVLLLCANCHRLQSANHYNDFKNIIEMEDLFEYSAEKIDELIDKSILKHPSFKNRLNDKKKIRDHITAKVQIKTFIKKRFVIENIYGGKCIGCGKNLQQIELPSYDFHHFDKIREKFIRWRDISGKSLDEIIKILIDNNAICLCANCHRMIHSFRFVKNVREILGKKYEDSVKKDYKTIQNNVKNFSFSKVHFNDPLKKLFEIPLNEMWIKYLIHIYEIVKLKKENRFTADDLAHSMNLSRDTVYARLKTLLDKGFIELLNPDAYQHEYILKKEGKEFIKKYINSLDEPQKRQFKNLLNEIKIKKETDFREKGERLRIFLLDRVELGKTWLKRIIHIYFIITLKKKNKFRKFELEESLDRVLNKSHIEDLESKGMIISERVGHRTKLYSITEKGKEKVENFLKKFNVSIKDFIDDFE